MSGFDEERLREAIRRTDPWRDIRIPPPRLTAAEIRELADRKAGIHADAEDAEGVADDGR
jgi:hypothetical protein